MNILSYNLGHDGAIVCLQDAQLALSIEAEKNSNWRYSPISGRDVFDALGELDEIPDVICTGGWWPARPRRIYMGRMFSTGACRRATLSWTDGFCWERPLDTSRLPTNDRIFFALSGCRICRKGTPCYALLWEGVIGSFYEIDSELNITMLADVMHEPGHRYSLLYGLADPTFEKSSAGLQSLH